MAQPDIPSTPLQTQFNKVAGQKQRDLGQLGNGDQTGPQAGPQETTPSSFGPTVAKPPAAIPPGGMPADAKPVASVQPDQGATSKAQPNNDWAGTIAQAIQQKPNIGRNTFLPIDFGKDPQMLWTAAHTVGRAWNALTDPSAMSQSAGSVWSDQSVRGYTERQFLQSIFPLLDTGDAVDKTKALLSGGNGQSATSAGDASRWLATNAMPMALTAGADFSYPTFAAALIGSGPSDVTKVPGAAASATPLGALTSAISDPEQLKTPQGASRLFWKYRSEERRVGK